MSTLVTRGAGRPGTPWRKRLTPYTFVLPTLVGLGLFLIYPLLSAVYFSFTNIRLETLTDPPSFVGWNNWRFLLEDIRLGKAIENTVWLVLVMVPARMLGALLTALFLNQVKRGRGVYRTIFYLPALAPPVAATIAFVLLLKPGTGPVNTLLAKLGMSSPPLWFNDPDWAKPSLVFLALWGIGDLMIIFIAALLDVPAELHEAAALDGANAWQRFRYVTLPGISPVLQFAAITGVIATLQYFTQAAVAASVASGSVTAGGGITNVFGYPNDSTFTYPLRLYTVGFGTGALGYASVLSLVLFAVSLSATLLLLRRFRTFL
ncbi:sugar ABC transporter permease [Rhizocola hellebori]|uniref:Sugar ABC transporter permease n=1 Tax=Rhizocola hellebori TaxID=1392758 RepID=A0A8J3QBV7_9ACTN|nr:sugar ABC transporter permease [Rhizocola hellebori]GIH07084.1 sugar ABC transporter permease [Rhizocola hellebori]